VGARTLPRILKAYREAPGFGYAAVRQPRDQSVSSDVQTGELCIADMSSESVFALAWPMLFILSRTPRGERGLQGQARLPPGGIEQGEETAQGGAA
jgi:hypothetical protein